MLEEDSSRGRSPVRSERQRPPSHSTNEDASKEEILDTKNLQKNGDPSHTLKQNQQEDLVLVQIEVIHALYETAPLKQMIRKLSLENAGLRKKLDESNQCCSCFYKAKTAFLKFWGFK